jgi:hypothetical protein
MDFIEGLPRSGRFNCILVVVDKFSRYAHFIPLAHPFSAADVAMDFMDNVVKLHSMPEQIISCVQQSILAAAIYSEWDNVKYELFLSS